MATSRTWLERAAGGALGLLVVVSALTSGLGACSTTKDAPCGSEPDIAACGRLGYECGSVTVCYACGVAKRLDCGQCGETQTCGGGGVAHKCWPPLGAEAGASEAEAGSDAEAEASASADAQADAAADAGSQADAAAPADADVIDASIDASAIEDASVEPMALCSEDAVAE